MSGKIENIKNIIVILPEVDALRKRCFEARSGLDSIITELKNTSRAIVQERESAEQRAEKQKEYADLIRQRQQEREAAEKIVDERTESRLRAAAPKNPTPVVKNDTEQAPVNTQQAPERPAQHTQSAHRTWTPNNNTAQRPPFQPRQQGTGPYQPRPYPPRDGQQQRPFQPRDGQQRPYPPRPQGSGPYQPRPYPPRDGQRPFAQRPDGQRPFPPRPAGATTPRPLGAIKPTEKFVPKPNTFTDNKKKVKSFNADAKPVYDKRALLRRGMMEEQEIEERMLTRIFKSKKAKENSGKNSADKTQQAIVINTNNLTVKNFSEKIGKTVPEIIKQLMVLGSMCTINSVIDFGTAELVAMEFGLELELHADMTFEEKLGAAHKTTDDADQQESRPPVVTVMGHVDHGKTSLLDSIRKTNVADKEAGKITQHIGAYQVKHNGKKITFLDTPGHAAFDKMRARGAKITDIAILLVAADDGVMPTTVEAIEHIKKQELPMIIAANKIDKKEANLDKIKQQLAEHNVLTEEWGGDSILVPVSAKTGEGIDKLLEMILLVSEMNDYKANPNKDAAGAIIEAQLDKQKGPVVTVLVQSGTLRVGDTLLAGTTYGKVRVMMDEKGKAIKKALPGTPVSVLGFSEVPKAGDDCYAVDEKLTKQVVSERKNKEKNIRTKQSLKNAGEIDALAQLDRAGKTQLPVIIKGDVSGSVEAINQSVRNITSDEVIVNIISSGVGAINDNDVALAEMSGALLIAFHVNISQTAAALAKKLKVKIHEFKVIYEIFDFITDNMVKLFKPKFEEKYIGKAEVRAVFKSSAIGLIAGCMVVDGKIQRNMNIKLHRGDEIIGTYKMASLKINKDDAKEVAQGFECGIKLEGNVEVKNGDILECIGQEQLPIIFNGKKYEI